MCVAKCLNRDISGWFACGNQKILFPPPKYDLHNSLPLNPFASKAETISDRGAI